LLQHRFDGRVVAEIACAAMLQEPDLAVRRNAQVDGFGAPARGGAR
jgi:hypothetical protein